METTKINTVNETATAIEQNNNNNCKNIEFAIDTMQSDDLINGNIIDNDEFDFDSSDLDDNSDTDANQANCELATIKNEQNVSSTNAKDDIDCSNQIQNEVHSIDPLMPNDKSIVPSNTSQLDEEMVQEQDQNDEQKYEEVEEEEEEPIFYYLEKSNEIVCEVFTKLLCIVHVIWFGDQVFIIFYHCHINIANCK